jgi:hypothetical protein
VACRWRALCGVPLRLAAGAMVPRSPLARCLLPPWTLPRSTWSARCRDARERWRW